MSTEEAIRLARAEVGAGRELPDIDPLLEGEMLDLQTEIERLELERRITR
jgi:hypothetical protein